MKAAASALVVVLRRSRARTAASRARRTSTSARRASARSARRASCRANACASAKARETWPRGHCARRPRMCAATVDVEALDQGVGGGRRAPPWRRGRRERGGPRRAAGPRAAGNKAPGRSREGRDETPERFGHRVDSTKRRNRVPWNGSSGFHGVDRMVVMPVIESGGWNQNNFNILRQGVIFTAYHLNVPGEN